MSKKTEPTFVPKGIFSPPCKIFKELLELFQGHCVLYALRFRGAEPLPLSADILLGIRHLAYLLRVLFGSDRDNISERRIVHNACQQFPVLPDRYIFRQKPNTVLFGK